MAMVESGPRLGSNRGNQQFQIWNGQRLADCFLLRLRRFPKAAFQVTRVGRLTNMRKKELMFKGDDVLETMFLKELRTSLQKICETASPMGLYPWLLQYIRLPMLFKCLPLRKNSNTYDARRMYFWWHKQLIMTQIPVSFYKNQIL